MSYQLYHEIEDSLVGAVEKRSKSTLGLFLHYLGPADHQPIDLQRIAQHEA